MRLYTYLLPENADNCASVSAWEWRTFKFSSNAAPKTAPPRAIAFFASSGKIPPEELAMRSGKSFDFAAKTERGKTGFA